MNVQVGYYYKHIHTGDLCVVEKITNRGGVVISYKMLLGTIVFSTAQFQFEKLFKEHNP